MPEVIRDAKGRRSYKCSRCGEIWDTPDQARACALADRTLTEIAMDEADREETGGRWNNTTES